MNPGTVRILDGMIDRGRDYPPTQPEPVPHPPQRVDLIAELMRAHLPVCAFCDDYITGRPITDDIPRLTRDRPAWCSTECKDADTEAREYAVTR